MSDFSEMTEYSDFELISCDSQGVSLYRANRLGKQPVIVKTLAYSNEEENMRIEQEYKILVQIKQQYATQVNSLPGRRKSAGVSRRASQAKQPSLPTVLDIASSELPFPSVFRLEKIHIDQVVVNALVYEDFGGNSLRELYPSNFDQFLNDNILARSMDNINIRPILKVGFADSLGSVNSLLEDKLSMEEMVYVFSQVAEVLDCIHRLKIVHNGIDPDHIFIKRMPGKELPVVQIRNFQLACRFEDLTHFEHQNRVNYAYMSPEQSGRTERFVDYRTDMYSLGIVLWELFTDEHPFNTDMIYAHLAKVVSDPRVKNPNIPEQLANLIQKLVKKDPADRYQLASAVKYDLTQILSRISFVRHDMEISSLSQVPIEAIMSSMSQWVWDPCTRDFSPFLQIPKKPQGRESELQLLIDIFSEWRRTKVEDRKSKLICLSSAEGGGKTAFANHLSEFACKSGALCISAKFLSSESGTPYVGICSILGQLVSFLLSESDKNLKMWEHRLTNEMKLSRLQILHYFAPSISHVVSHSNLQHNSFAMENKLEIFMCVEQFLSMFATKENPLLLNVGSLVAGPGSLELYNHLLQSNILSSCFFIGYYSTGNDSFVNYDELLEALGTSTIGVYLNPLTLDEIVQFLDDTLTPYTQSLTSLATLFLQRTQGNVLFLQELTKFCEKQELIYFDQTSLFWSWDMKRIEAEAGVAANAVSLMIKQLDDLENKSKDCLKFAACIGLEFDVRTLSLIMGDPIMIVINTLGPAILAGYVLPVKSPSKLGSASSELGSKTGLSIYDSGSIKLSSNNSIAADPFQRRYKFCHGRIQEAMANEVADSECKRISLLITHILRHIEEKSTENNNDLMKHYTIAMSIITEDEDLLLFAELHYTAGMRTGIGLSGYMQTHLETALMIILKLQINTNQTDALKLNIKSSLVLIYIKTDQITAADLILSDMEQNFDTDPQLSVKISLKIQLLVAKNRLYEAYDTGLNSSSDLGLWFQRFGNFRSGVQSLKMLEERLESKSSEEILRPAVDSLHTIQLIDSMLQNCLGMCRKRGDWANAAQFSILGVNLVLDHGTTANYCHHFSEVIPLYLGSTFGYYDFKRAQYFGEIALMAINSVNDERKAVGVISLLRGYTLFWGFAETSAQVEGAGALALVGQIPGLFTRLMIKYHQSCLLTYGKTLEFIRDVDKKHRLNLEYGSTDMKSWAASFTAYEDFANGVPINLKVVEGLHHVNHLIHLYHVKVIQSMMFSWDDRDDLLHGYKSKMCDLRSTWMFVDILVCNVILNCEKYSHNLLDEAQQSLLMKLIESEIEEIFQYVHLQQSGEHRFKYLLVKAEQAKVSNNIKVAIESYEESLESAQTAKNTLFCAWINELYGKFWLSANSPKIAKSFFALAHTMYEDCGIDSKLNDLLTKYPEMFRSRNNSVGRKMSIRKSRFSSIVGQLGEVVKESIAASSASGNSDSNLYEYNRGGSTASKKVMDIDINTVLKVTNSITNETDLGALVDKILGHLMNNTGASRAVFLFNDKTGLKLQKILTTVGVEEFNPLKIELAIPMSLLNYVFRTQESKVYMDCPTDSNFANDTYIELNQPKSILCCPIKHQNMVTGVIYLENRFQTGTFTATRVNLVKSLMASASIAIANAQLLQKNKELSDALQDSNAVASAGRNNTVETPMQKVFDAIKSIKDRFDPNDPIVNTLDAVLSALTSDGLFAANLADVNDRDGKGIDQDTKNWIESSLLMTNRGTNEQNSNMVPRKADPIFEMHGQMSNVGQGKLNIEKINAHLEISSSPAFDCFKLAELTENQPLFFLTSYILKKFRLHETFHLNQITLDGFLQKIECSYNKLPYHNSLHATDVLQTVGMLLLDVPDIICHFSPLEIFSICIASAIHDLDHPGINNNFLVQLNHPIAIMYNDTAVLESHHVARAFEIASLPGLNIFESMTPDQYRQSRKMIISIVLATGICHLTIDLAQHFQFISKFKGKVSSSALKLEDEADRHLIMEMAVKCGDLGNPVKTFDQAKKWTNLVMEEFFRQRKAIGITNIQVYGSTGYQHLQMVIIDYNNSQIGFIDFLVAPLFDTWSLFSKTDYTNTCLSNIATNRLQWQLRADDPDLLPGVPANEFEKLDNLLDISIPSISFGKGMMDSRRTSGTTPKRFVFGKPDTELHRIFENEDMKPVTPILSSLSASKLSI